MRKLSRKAVEFCRLIVYERESHARAYLHAAYGDTKNANVKAYQLLQKDYIQAEIQRLELKIAAQAIVDRNLMTKKYFELAEICQNEHDRPTQKGCYDSICKIQGLSIDVTASGDSAAAEIDDARKLAAAAIPDSYFLESTKLPGLPAPVERYGVNQPLKDLIEGAKAGNAAHKAMIEDGSASQDAVGLTNDTKSDVIVPPAQ